MSLHLIVDKHIVTMPTRMRHASWYWQVQEWAGSVNKHYQPHLYHNIKLKRLRCVKMSLSLYACYACGECGGLLITSVAQIYFIFPQLPFPGWLGGGEAVNNIQWASPYTQIQGNYYLSMFSFCSQEENQFCGELRGKGHKEDICLVRYPSHCERRPNKRCMAAFAILHHLETK